MNGIFGMRWNSKMGWDAHGKKHIDLLKKVIDDLEEEIKKLKKRVEDLENP